MKLFRVVAILGVLATGLVLLNSGSVATAADVTGRDQVVAKVNGRAVTAGELEDYRAGAPPGMAAPGLRDTLQEYALQSELAGMAKDMGLAEKSPYREQLVYQRKSVLAQAMLKAKTEELGDQGAGPWMAQVAQQSRPANVNEEFLSLSYSQMGQADRSTVVATINGDPFTAADLTDVLLAMGPAGQQNFRAQPQQFLTQYGTLDRLARLAEAAGLEDKSPVREQLAWIRLQLLSQARMNTYQNAINIGPDLQRAYYASHQDRYTDATVKVIYLAFDNRPGQVNPDGTPVRTEQQALELARQIKQRIENGEDFVKLVAEYSQEPQSKSKDGDFGTLVKTDPSIPQPIKDGVFSLKKGDISDPIKLANGFYIFRIEAIQTHSLDEVLQTLMVDAKTDEFQKWMDGIRNSLDITYEKPEYFESN